MSTPSLREIAARTRARGVSDTSKRVVRHVWKIMEARMNLRSLDFPLDGIDIADSHAIPSITPFRGTHKQRIAWICTPPSPGSGGHTTLFRMVQALQERGHQCTVLLYNLHGGDMDRHIQTIRQSWPGMTADVRGIPRKIRGFDACVASSWETAHVLASRMTQGEPMNPFYFIQDYEPYFYPRGSLYALSEETYRFGFTNIALGPMVSELIRREVGADSRMVPFGADLENYHLDNLGKRTGVVFFVRPDVDRRGFELGRLALEEFHRNHPSQEIHTYGSVIDGWKIPVTQHGVLSPLALNRLYNRTVAGLALSFTNVTLVAAEMLAAGNLVVLNDDEFAKRVLHNPEATWALPTPLGLAQALGAVVTDPAQATRAMHAATYRPVPWSETQEAAAQIILGDPGVSPGIPATDENSALAKEYKSQGKEREQ